MTGGKRRIAGAGVEGPVDGRRGAQGPSRVVVRKVVAVVALCCTTACYTFRAVEPGTLTQGSAIRVTVTPEEAARQRAIVGILTEQLEGRLIDTRSDSVGLAVREWAGSPATRPDFSTYIAVPRSSILQFEQKELNVGRTVALAGAAAVVAAAVLAISVSSAGDNGEPPPTTELRIPLIRFPLLAR